MGRAIPSSRTAAEFELTMWEHFRSFLHKNDRKIFDEKFAYSDYIIRRIDN